MKLRELIEERNNKRYKLEVYKEIFIFLQEFVSTDNREAKKSIELEGVDKQFVPNIIIEEIIEHIEKSYILPLDAELQTLDEKVL